MGGPKASPSEPTTSQEPESAVPDTMETKEVTLEQSGKLDIARSASKAKLQQELQTQKPLGLSDQRTRKRCLCPETGAEVARMTTILALIQNRKDEAAGPSLKHPHALECISKR